MKKGFTLIELLIVVAIIAILAAIAIPNFLQAQTRAKVARVKGELRTLATSLETYYVDHNQYPLHDTVLENYYFLGSSRYCEETSPIIKLTTPVSYLSSISTDPFNPQPQGGGLDYPYRYLTSDQSPIATSCPYAFEAFGYWTLISAGPDGSSNFITYILWGASTFELNFNNNVYDPTNGIDSSGDIYRSQKSPDGGGI